MGDACAVPAVNGTTTPTVLTSAAHAAAHSATLRPLRLALLVWSGMVVTGPNRVGAGKPRRETQPSGVYPGRTAPW
jgi:hypothetical protein